MALSSRLQGRWEVRRRDRESGLELPPLCFPNAVQTAGKELLLDLGTGASTTYLDQAGAVLRLLDSTPAEVFSQVGSDAAPDHSTQGQVVWEWTDSSTNAYTIATLEVRQGTTTGTLFSSAACTLADCSKPSTQIWTYRYTLTISGSAPLDVAGLDEWLQALTNTSSGRWGSGNTKLRVTNSDASLEAEVSTSSGPTRSGTAVDWEFEAGGSVANFSWYWLEVRGNPWPDMNIPGLLLSRNDDLLGSKTSGETWRWPYQFSIS